MVTTAPTPLITYTLDAGKLAQLRAGRTDVPRDPVTRREFAVGDVVVFCGAHGCGLPMLLTTWQAAGNHCPSAAQTMTTARNPEFDSPGYRPPRIRTIIHPRRVTPPQPVSLEHRIWRACLAEAILAVTAYLGWQFWLALYNLPHTWKPQGIVFLLEPLLWLILIPLFIITTIGVLIGAVVLTIGTLFIVFNVFAASPAYVDPVERIWAAVQRLISGLRDRF